jgi:hypothetical protein
MKLTRWTIALYMGLVFVGGGVVGALGHRLYTVSTVSANVSARNPEEVRKRYLAELQARLKLNDDQLTKMNAILDDTRVRVRAARAIIDPDIKKIRDEQDQQVAQILSTEQQAEWQKMNEERRNRKNKRRGGGATGSRTP